MINLSKITFASILLSFAINTPLFSTVNLTDEEERAQRNSIKQAILQGRSSFPGKVSDGMMLFDSLPNIANTSAEAAKDKILSALDNPNYKLVQVQNAYPLTSSTNYTYSQSQQNGVASAPQISNQRNVTNISSAAYTLRTKQDNKPLFTEQDEPLFKDNSMMTMTRLQQQRDSDYTTKMSALLGRLGTPKK